jgi:predicted CopG family antitoxin
MGHKTLTISEEAYEALSSLKKERESFTEAILRITKKAERGNLLDYIKTLSPDEEFACILDQVVDERKNVSLRSSEE